MPAVIWLTQFCLFSGVHSAQQYHVSFLKNLLKKDLGFEIVLFNVLLLRNVLLVFGLVQLCKVIKK